MGCGGGCPKKQIKLRTHPQGISRVLVEEMQNYVDHKVLVRDRIGNATLGTCLDVWIDDDQTGEVIESGNIAIETKTGISMIGLNIVESIELFDAAQ